MNNLEFAIAMEKEGERYYLAQAELNKDNSLNKVCLLMAEDERKHAKILADLLKGKREKLEDRDFFMDLKSVFDNLEETKDGAVDAKSQLEFYKDAQEKEKESIELYLKLRDASCLKEDVEIYDFLIAQEKEHYEVLGELIKLLTHGEEWVESPEFGLREDY